MAVLLREIHALPNWQQHVFYSVVVKISKFRFCYGNSVGNQTRFLILEYVGSLERGDIESSESAYGYFKKVTAT